MDRDAKCASDAVDVVERNVSSQSFNMANERSMKAALKCQRLLGPAPRPAKADHVGGQQLPPGSGVLS